MRLYIKICVLLFTLFLFYSYKFLNMGIQGNDNSFFTCYLKVVLDQLFEILEFVLDYSISHCFVGLV